MAQNQAEDLNKQLAQIIEKAWTNPAFKRRLIEDPKAIAQEYGIYVPQDLEVRVVENTKTRVHVILPVKPPEELLSDEALKGIVGGVAAAPGATDVFGNPVSPIGPYHT